MWGIFWSPFKKYNHRTCTVIISITLYNIGKNYITHLFKTVIWNLYMGTLLNLCYKVLKTSNVKGTKLWNQILLLGDHYAFFLSRTWNGAVTPSAHLSTANWIGGTSIQKVYGDSICTITYSYFSVREEGNIFFMLELSKTSKSEHIKVLYKYIDSR